MKKIKNPASHLFSCVGDAEELPSLYRYDGSGFLFKFIARCMGYSPFNCPAYVTMTRRVDDFMDAARRIVSNDK